MLDTSERFWIREIIKLTSGTGPGAYLEMPDVLRHRRQRPLDRATLARLELWRRAGLFQTEKL